MSAISELQAEIAAWADEVVPNRSPLSIVCKMLEELSELIASEKMSDPSEVADVVILALDLCHLQGINLEAAVRDKMHLNRQRTWNVSDNGRAQHVN